MRGEPDGTEEQDDAKEQLCAHSDGAVQGRLERGNILGRPNKNKHCTESHGHDEDGGHYRGDDHLHGSWTRPPPRGTEKDSATGGKSECRRPATSGGGPSDSTRDAGSLKLSASRTSRRPR